MQENIIVTAAQTASVPKPSTTIQPLPDVFPGNIPKNEALDERTQRILLYFSWKLVHTNAYAMHELDDIMQELSLLLLQRMMVFNPDKGDRYKYAGIVAASGIKNMLRARDRSLRRSGGLLSLQDKSNGCEEPLGNLVSVDDYMEMIEGGMVPVERRRDFIEALRELFGSLDDMDRKICIAIMKYSSAEQASKHIGIPARTILWRLKNIIRPKAVDAELNEILGGVR